MIIIPFGKYTMPPSIGLNSVGWRLGEPPSLAQGDDGRFLREEVETIPSLQWLEVSSNSLLASSNEEKLCLRTLFAVDADIDIAWLLSTSCANVYVYSTVND